MVTINNDPDAGGNKDQPDDGRDELGRLPEPLDAGRFPHEALDLPGMPLSQPAGTGAIISSPPPPVESDEAEQPAAEPAEAPVETELAEPEEAATGNADEDAEAQAKPKPRSRRGKGGDEAEGIGLDRTSGAEANTPAGDSAK